MKSAAVEVTVEEVLPLFAAPAAAGFLLSLLILIFAIKLPTDRAPLQLTPAGQRLAAWMPLKDLSQNGYGELK